MWPPFPPLRKFATAEVQISESETPLHKLETVYRRLTERIATSASSSGAFRSIIDTWFFALEEDVLSSGKVKADDAVGLVGEFEIDPFRKHCILNGLDDIALTLEHADRITDYELNAKGRPRFFFLSI